MSTTLTSAIIAIAFTAGATALIGSAYSRRRDAVTAPETAQQAVAKQQEVPPHKQQQRTTAPKHSIKADRVAARAATAPFPIGSESDLPPLLPATMASIRV